MVGPMLITYYYLDFYMDYILTYILFNILFLILPQISSTMKKFLFVFLIFTIPFFAYSVHYIWLMVLYFCN